MPTYYNKDGIRIEMRPREDGHNLPHIHVRHGGDDAAILFDGRILKGEITNRKAYQFIKQWILKKDWRDVHHV